MAQPQFTMVDSCGRVPGIVAQAVIWIGEQAKGAIARAFSPLPRSWVMLYFFRLAGGMMLFMRRYSTICP